MAHVPSSVNYLKARWYSDSLFPGFGPWSLIFPLCLTFFFFLILMNNFSLEFDLPQRAMNI